MEQFWGIVGGWGVEVSGSFWKSAHCCEVEVVGGKRGRERLPTAVDRYEMRLWNLQ